MNVIRNKKRRVIFFRDVAIQFRMQAGFAGDVNRTHPASIEPALLNATTPPTAFGQAVLADTAGPTNTVRMLGSGDASVTDIYGITVRPFPVQASSTPGNYGATGTASAPFGTAGPPALFPVDVLRAGYIMVQLNPTQASPTKGATVYVRTGATSGNNIQGGFETTASTSATLSSRYTYNGPADASGNVEICIR
jgi:hypothetical protein